MNFQDKLVETTAELRTRALALTQTALDVARSQAARTATRVAKLRGTVGTLTDAGRAFGKVAQRHGSRFVKENTALALAAGKDVRGLARSTVATLTAAKPAKAREARVTRKRAAKAA